MRPLQCPSCGQSLGATPPGPGGRRTCARCQFSFVPVQAAGDVEEGILERHPLLLLALLLVPFVVGALLQAYAPRLLPDFLRPEAGSSLETVVDAGSSGATFLSTPVFEVTTPTAATTASTLSARFATGPEIYPAEIVKVAPHPPGMQPPDVVLPRAVAPPLPPMPRASLELLSSPPGAAIYDDVTGVGFGVTPLVLALDPGAYRFRFTLPGRKTRVATVTLSPAQASQISVELGEEDSSAPGMLLIDSEPIQADVYRDGILMGATPLSLELPGGKEFLLVLRKAGFEDLVLTVRVPPGGRQQIRAILPPGSESAFPTSGATSPEEEQLRRLTAAGGTAPPLGAFKAALPVLGSAANQQLLTGGVQPDKEGAVSGIVQLAGPSPTIEFIPVRVDAATCGQNPRASQKLVVDPNGGLQNVVVQVIDAKLDEQLGPPITDSSLQIADCTFLPHVQAIPLDTTVRLSNLNQIPFRIRFTDPAGLTTDLALGPGEVNRPLRFPAAGVFRVSEMRGHDWMQASIHVMPNPYFTITSPGGRFFIGGIPAGDYTLQVWQESLGTKAVSISVKAGETTTAAFAYSSPE